MNRIGQLVTLALILVTSHARCARPSSKIEADGSARAVINALAGRNYKSLVHEFCYPEAGRMAGESAWLSRALPYLEERFGTIGAPTPASPAVNAHMVGVGAGITDDWVGKGATRYAFRVRFARVGDGWVFLDFTDACGEPALKSIQYALPAESPGALSFVLETRAALTARLPGTANGQAAQQERRSGTSDR